MQKRVLVIVVIVAIVFLGIVGSLIFSGGKKNKQVSTTENSSAASQLAEANNSNVSLPVINSFHECAIAGNLVENSQPARCKTEDGRIFIEQPGEVKNAEKAENGVLALERGEIELLTLEPNQRIKSPLRISGKAKKEWFFLETIPVRIVNDSGQTVAFTKAIADTEAQTDGLIPFSATISFPAISGAKGKIIFEKSNPSNLPEENASVEVPVFFYAE